MMYCSFSYSHICMKSWLHYLFNYIFLYFAFSYCSVLWIIPIFACNDLNFHFLQYIPCFARTRVQGNLGLYLIDNSMDVILTTQHGFRMSVRVKIDKDSHSYFDADHWRKNSKFYELKAGNKILVRAPHSGQINMDVCFPSVISRPQPDQS